MPTGGHPEASPRCHSLFSAIFLSISYGVSPFLSFSVVFCCFLSFSPFFSFMLMANFRSNEFSSHRHLVTPLQASSYIVLINLRLHKIKEPT